MAVNYSVQAEIVDIRNDQPRASDAFLVDSNIWFWMTYSGSGLSNDWRARVYPNYFRKSRQAKAKIYRCGLSFAELAHLIERVEYEIFEHTHPGERPKWFRHNYPAERTAVVTDIRNAWRIVKSMGTPLGITLDDPAVDLAATRCQSQLLDGYDLFMAQAMDAAGVNQILTDDGDYCTVPGIQVFTANRAVIEAATSQGNLVTR